MDCLKASRYAEMDEDLASYFRRISSPAMRRRRMKRDLIDRRFTMLFLDAFERLTRNCDLSGKTWAVFMFIVSKSEYDNFVEVNQGAISKHVGIARQNVSKAIKQLVEKGMIDKGPKVGSRYTYRINWEYVWRGTTEKYREEQRREIARRLEIVK